MSSDDILAALPRARPGHRHTWRPPTPAMLEDGDWREVCSRCLAVRDPERSRRGRSARRRGNALQARVARDAGISNIGPLGLPEDAGMRHEWLVLQVKSGQGYPRRLDRWLRAMAATADQLRGVVYVETPGPGHRAHRLITLDYDEFLEWFGGESHE
jgi:hypothetical protein